MTFHLGSMPMARPRLNLDPAERAERVREQNRERGKRHRAKRKPPAATVRVPISAGEVAETLISSGDLPAWDADDPGKVAAAIAKLLRRLGDGLA